MKKFSLVWVLVIIIFLLSGCGNIKNHQTPANNGFKNSSPAVSLQTQTEENLKVTFIDVGQGDSILLQLPNHQTMLIDAGGNEAAPTLMAFLNNQGIMKIDYLIGTHPHEDHIGGMDKVILSLAVGSIYMPKVLTTTKSFEDVLLAIKAKGLKINTGKSGTTIMEQGRLKITLLAPCGSNYEEINDFSLVTKVEFGSNSFLFTGDAQELSEEEMLKAGFDLHADVLKVGHHGSSSSTTPAFLKAVDPQYAIISVGEGNDYNHPHAATLDKLSKAGIEIYRTDLNGYISITSNGQIITVVSQKQLTPENPMNLSGSAPALDEPSINNNSAASAVYIGNTRSKKFHLPTCPNLPAAQNQIRLKTREDAVAKGFAPCGACNP